MPNLRLRPLELLICFMPAAQAGAGPSDALHLYGGVSFGHDDNLLRVSDRSAGFGNTREDSWWTREYGLVFDKTYSRQQIAVVAKFSNTNFDHFKQLNYAGKDLQANWHWQIGNYLDGRIGTTYQRLLAPYTDFSTDQRNVRTTRSQYAEGAWRFHSSWRARAGFKRDKFDYELISQRYNNRTEEASELELDYLMSNGSTAGLLAHRLKGTYPYLRPFDAFGLNDNFMQNELRMHMKWIATEASTLDASIGYTSRKQPSFDESRTNGVAGTIRATYQPRGKMTYNAAIWRDFAPLESTLVSYTLNKGASLGAQWDATEKIKINADLIAERRSYRARTTVSNPRDLGDSIRTARVQATWLPSPGVQVSSGVAHQARSGSLTLGTGNFTSNSITLSASVQF
jgi:exopolysaccharide biosynthesis operon protein EpsL